MRKLTTYQNSQVKATGFQIRAVTKHSNVRKSRVTHKLCSSGNVSCTKPKSKIITFTLSEGGLCLPPVTQASSGGVVWKLQWDGKSITGALEKALESEWNIAVVGMSSWERDGAKGTPLKAGWVLLCAGCRCWRWHLAQELWVCSPDKQELGRSEGRWWGCLSLAEHQLWSHQEQLGAPRLDQGCSCTPWLAGRGWCGATKLCPEPGSTSNMSYLFPVPCRAAPGYQLLPALSHTEVLIQSQVLCTKALSRSLELQASSFITKPLRFPSNRLLLLSKVYDCLLEIIIKKKNTGKISKET